MGKPGLSSEAGTAKRRERIYEQRIMSPSAIARLINSLPSNCPIFPVDFTPFPLNSLRKRWTVVFDGVDPSKR